MLHRLGCEDFRTMTARDLTIDNAEVQKKLDGIGFISATVRAFKLNIEDRCEDFGQKATYTGGINESPKHFDLDDHHRFEKGEPMAVCGNTADMLGETRFSKFFKIEGEKKQHFGLFDCGPDEKGACSAPSTDGGGGCC